MPYPKAHTLPLLLLASLIACDDPPPVEVVYPSSPLHNATCLAFEEPPPEATGVTLEVAFGGESFAMALGLVQHPSDDDRWYVVRQTGQVETFVASDAAGTRAQAFAIGGLAGGGEQGLLAMAFAPDFDTSGVAYVSYVAEMGATDDTVIARMVSNDGGLTFAPHADYEVLRFRQPAGNHNGGDLAFGSDGYLYLAFGDGGGAGDPFDNGQDPDTLFGAILRIDVSTHPYTIPSDNPFVGVSGADEIWAYGLRNPWRMSFDQLTGQLIAGDVGQGEIEEVDLIVAGANYGWPLKEGRECFRADPCSGLPGLTDPFFQYDHSLGVAVTGGYVYRGTDIPSLEGKYVLGDFGSGRIWAVADFDQANPTGELVLDTNLSISSFGQGRDGEIYVVSLRPAGAAINRLIAVETDPGGPGLPADSLLLSQSGCVLPYDPERLATGVVPYTVAATLHSDGAEKHRGMALPDGAQVTIGDDGDLRFPVGSVLVKQFYLNGEPIETRLFKHHPSGWRGYSYEWDESGTDAVLLGGAVTVDIDGQDWLYPSPTQCLICHTRAAGRALGPELGQLQGGFDYAAAGFPLFAGRVDQLAALRGLGILPIVVPPPYRALPRYDDTDAPLADRARAYLHANCSNCHRPGGGGGGDLDLRFETPLGQTGVCEPPSAGTLGLDDPRIVLPGASDRSVLLERMLRLDTVRMPPLATNLVDDQGTALVEAWIDALPSCP